jgi:tetratricopeptide (TPR) repeat protein
VNIRVSYLLEATGYSPFAAFYYLLETGAGWKGPIGSADLIVRLPYEATPQNVLLTEHTGWSLTTPGASLDGREVRWHYNNLEPTRENNLEISIVQPSYWKKVLNELENTTRNPRDGEAWGRLGRAYKDIAFFSKGPREDPEGEKLFELSREAYERCLELLPEDALWHSGIAELYLMHFNTTHWVNPEAIEDLLPAVEAVHRALEIDPETPKALELAEELTWIAPNYVVKKGDQYIFLALTATPAPIDLQATAAPTDTDLPPTSVPTAVPASPTDFPASPTMPPVTPKSTSTAIPTLPVELAQMDVQASPAASPTVPAAVDSPNGGLSVCGVALFPLLLIMPLASLRLKKPR